MPRKKKRKAKPPGSARVPRFEVGAHLQVRRGVMDPNYPDIPLGGYAGRVVEIDNEGDGPVYLIDWDEETLDQMPEVFLTRCERDDLDYESIWLAEEDLEPAPDSRAPIEQPTALRPRALRRNDPDDRIRMLFGLTSDDPLPPRSQEALARFHAHLVRRLKLPCPGVVITGDGTDVNRVELLRLLDPEHCNLQEGLIVEVGASHGLDTVPLVMTVIPDTSPHVQDFHDYHHWFLITEDDVDEAEDDLADAMMMPPSLQAVWLSYAKMIVYGAGCGASLGALYAVVPSAQTAMYVGGAIVGVLGYLLGSTVSRVSQGRLQPGSTAVGVLGGILGALVGAALGIMLAGGLGTIPGAIAGSILGKLLAGLGFRPTGEFGWALLGAFTGGVIVSFYWDQHKALEGAKLGTLIGGGVVTAVVLLAFFAINFARPEGMEGGDDE